ncbi:MAG TPA: DUF1501 domain-containing protein [Nannocystaceae bacterium]|nr:DUF1501 domain-containing protein [Nannocystaceae bacterium]
MITRIPRRSFIGLGAAAATTIVAPTIWIPRAKGAPTPGFGKAKHLVVVYLDGGARSSCLFNANVAQQWNPVEISGAQPGAAGTEWGVGGCFDAAAYDGGVLGTTIAALPQISNRLCVLGTVDHTPGEDRGDGNHNTARIRMATGSPEGTRGLLSIVYRDHAVYQGANPPIPPVIVGSNARLFGAGAGEFGAYRPVVVNGWYDFIGNSQSTAVDKPQWALGFGEASDERLAITRAARHRAMVDGLRDSKLQAEKFRPVFTDPILDVEYMPDETLHGLTNAELLAALGTSDFSKDTALALRFMGQGAPAVVIGNGGWDYHSDELTDFPAQGQDLGRVLAGLVYALEHLDHPDGGTYWDHTLVCVCSEFSRDNAEANGFNSGNGSDHNGNAPCRYQAIPLFGGPVEQGGKFFGKTDMITMEPLEGEPVFSSISLLATMLDGLGIDPEPHFPAEPIAEIY